MSLEPLRKVILRPWPWVITRFRTGLPGLDAWSGLAELVLVSRRFDPLIGSSEKARKAPAYQDVSLLHESTREEGEQDSRTGGVTMADAKVKAIAFKLSKNSSILICLVPHPSSHSKPPWPSELIMQFD